MGIRNLVGSVVDPEIPVLTIDDLGILREVDVVDGRVVVTITPTYSGCPAMDVIAGDIRSVLAGAGYSDAVVRVVLAPAWTTDWMSESGRRKLLEYGIAPPAAAAAAAAGDGGGAGAGGGGGAGAGRAGAGGGRLWLTLSVRCPQCGSGDTRQSSRFGSTACKSLWVCNTCQEPFDHFKEI
jgi:ring-1,2-phenylacetyl-CoA epoxidase subunit PaaD